MYNTRHLADTQPTPLYCDMSIPKRSFLSVLLASFQATALAHTFFNLGQISGEYPAGDQGRMQLTTTQQTNFDDPKVTSFNSTSYDWWYFDATSASSDAHFVVVFYTAAPTGFAGVTGATSFTPVGFTATYPNGTFVEVARSVSADNATVWSQRNKQGTWGEWGGSGFSFSSQQGLDTYTIDIDSEELGVYGTLVYRNRGRPHYPCRAYGDPYDDPSYPDMTIIPGVGWANAFPDADVTAHVNIVDQATGEVSSIDFEDGVGYHDKNWGVQAFHDMVQAWYWGHARVGPYSLVWFDAINWEDTETFSAYISRDGEIVSASCEETSVRVRPYGNDTGDTFPPTTTSNYPEGITANFTLPAGEGILSLTFPNGLMVIEAGSYNRWISHKITARIGDVELPYQGTGLWEYFNIAVLRERLANASMGGVANTTGAAIASGLSG
jgi:hypothetical protein